MVLTSGNKFTAQSSYATSDAHSMVPACHCGKGFHERQEVDVEEEDKVVGNLEEAEEIMLV